MAIEKQPISGRAQSYWRNFSARASVLFLAGLILAILVIVLFVKLGSEADWQDEMSNILGGGNAWPVRLVGLVFVVLGINAATLYLIVKPQKRLYDSVMRTIYDKKSEEDQNFTKWEEKSGLAAMIKTLHESPSSDAPVAGVAVEAKSFLTEALESTDVGIVMFGEGRKVLYVNHSAPTRAGFDNEDALDLAFSADDSFSDWLNSIQGNTVKAEKIWQRVPSMPSENKEKEREYFDIIANYNSASEVQVILMIVNRSGEYQRDEDDLNLIAFAAHELRGPVTVIRGYLDLLLDDMGDTLTPDAKESFQRLMVSANRLSSYISNILNSSRYDQHQLNLNLTEQNIKGIFDMIEDDVKLRASTQGRTLSITCPDDLPTIAADPSGLGEVFTNLIDNAIKYSKEGDSVEVTAQKNSDESISVNVTDHGIGMPANVVGNLFRKFYRSHRSRGSAIGTGIGLFISKAIVAMHGGAMSVVSKEGEGSTFTVVLPTYEYTKDRLKDGMLDYHEIESRDNLIRNHGAIK